jgi:multimeric flavodoxin WrbA
MNKKLRGGFTMSKNILIISASPRKGGNSDTLCDQFAKGAKEAGNKVEKIFLKNYHINYCTGCGVCNTTHKCVLKDDMEPLLDKMVAADAIVLSTPVYFYSMAGQMKTFIDRCVPRYTEIEGKDIYMIITAADTSKDNMHKVIEALRGFTVDCLPACTEKGIVYGLGAWQVGEIKKLSAMKEAYEMGKRA